MSSGSESSRDLMIPNAQVSAQDLVRGNYTLAGWLRKRGRINVIPGARKVFPWLHQFVVLHEGCLYTFKSETARKPLRAFSLYGYNTVYRAGEVLPAEAPWAFKICHTFPMYKTYYFSAMTEQHMKEWMKQVKHEMKRANNKLKQRTRADGQEEDDQSVSYEDIEREIYGDPSQLVITEKTPVPPRQDDESDEDYMDAEMLPDVPPTPPMKPRKAPPPLPSHPKPTGGRVPGSHEMVAQQNIAAEFKKKLNMDPNNPFPKRKPPEGNSFSKKRIERKPPDLPVIPGRMPSDDESVLKSPSCPTDEPPPPPSAPPPEEDYWSRIHYDESRGKPAGELIRELGEDGVFLVRPSKTGDCNVLVVFVDNMPKQYRICQSEDLFYVVAPEKFKSTEDLVYHYLQNKLPCKICLNIPYFQHPKYKG